MVTSLMEMYLSMLNNQMARAANDTNVTVRRLTFITTIFMPLTLLAGIGGMSEWTMMTGAGELAHRLRGPHHRDGPAEHHQLFSATPAGQAKPRQEPEELLTNEWVTIWLPACEQRVAVPAGPQPAEFAP